MNINWESSGSTGFNIALLKCDGVRSEYLLEIEFGIAFGNAWEALDGIRPPDPGPNRANSLGSKGPDEGRKGGAF